MQSNIATPICMTAKQVGLETLWALVQGSPLAIFAVNKEGSILVWNKAAKQLFGWQEQDVLGKTNPIIPPGEEEEFQQLRDQALAGAIYTGMELDACRKDGTTVSISISTAPLCDNDGAIVGVMAVVKDISERKQMVKALQENLKKSQRVLNQTIEALASAVEQRDPYTAGHQRRVARLACAIAAEMGLKKERINGIHTAATIHDIGKLSIPAEILTKPGPISGIERQLLKTHAQAGYDILKGIEFPWPVAKMVQQHHEHIDGSGYPLGLKGDKILLEANIITVADVVEASSSFRPYQPANGIDFALTEIKEHKDRYYNSEVVYACLALFNKGFRIE